MADRFAQMYDEADLWHAPRRHALASLIDEERGSFFLWAPVCLGGGIAAYFALPGEPSLFTCFLPLLMVLVLRVSVRRGSIISAIINALLIAALGFALAKARVETVRAPVLTKALHNAEVVGVVTRAEARLPRGQRLTIAVEKIAGLAAAATPAVVRVRTMSGRVNVTSGHRVRVKATLSAPSKPALPGGFDYARLAWFERVGGVGYAFAPPVVEGVAEEGTLGSVVSFTIERVRQIINDRISAALPGENGAIAAALITGERGGISSETNSAFKNSGLFHILSISGLHMVIMAGAVFYSTRLAMAAVPRLALTLPIKKIAATIGIVSAIAYLSISGGAFATVRSALMIVIIFGAVLLDRPALALRNVALAAFIILAVYPESLLDAGFQMSFAAVTALIACHEEVHRRFNLSGPGIARGLMRFFGEIVISTLIASAAVAPLAAYQFHQSQQYAVLANVLAIPICNLVVMPSALLALVLMPVGLERVALVPMGAGIEAMKACASAVASLPGAVGYVPAIPTAAFALVLAGGIWLALWKTHLRYFGIALALAGLALAPWMTRPDIIVAQNGRLVAVRDASGKLAALPAKRGKFEIERWLEYDGDGRTAAEAQRSDAFRCDAIGCVARVKGATLSVSRSPAAIPDDCGLADILVVDAPRPADCKHPRQIIDVFDIWRNGNAAIYLDRQDASSPLSVRVETVAVRRGERPWSMLPTPHGQTRAALNLSKPKIATDAAGPSATASAPPDSRPREAAKSTATDDPAEEPGSDETDADQ